MSKAFRLGGTAVLFLVLLHCSGKTVGPTNVGTTSATLRAEVSCGDTGDRGANCYWYFQYRAVGQATQQTPQGGPAGAITNYVISENVTGLTPSTQYEYQICGKGDGVTTFVCVGPSGAETWQQFTTQADTQAPTVPTSLAATAGDARVTVSWTASMDNVGVTVAAARRPPDPRGRIRWGIHG